MKYILKEMNEDNLPREKVKKFGINSLNDYELLAIILKTGTKDKSVLDLSNEILQYYTSIENMNDLNYQELLNIKGIGEAKAIELIASIELGKRIINNYTSKKKIKSSLDAYDYLKYEMQNLKQEHFVCIYLNSNNQVICHKTISIGTGTETLADYKSAIKWALKFSSYGIIFAHNHPSGNPNPSIQDNELNKRLMNICIDLDLKYVDHIIISNNSFYSYCLKKVTNV